MEQKKENKRENRRNRRKQKHTRYCRKRNDQASRAETKSIWRYRRRDGKGEGEREKTQTWYEADQLKYHK